ncbi:hypothetical protein GDO78_002542 [Eleutherodactylus coqui]|uniref:Uncharacterized protein n=1 Tax=Eleutherodactylus coqui TaxID=57060 RepID=A0A8J6EYJ5_ELECQ|nr:hypothetical protein GDO78_002542 [Eleutherodactylus coqui]
MKGKIERPIFVLVWGKFKQFASTLINNIFFSIYSWIYKGFVGKGKSQDHLLMFPISNVMEMSTAVYWWWPSVRLSHRTKPQTSAEEADHPMSIGAP